MLSKILNVVNFYRAWKHGNGFKPIHVSLYPTYRCNLKCRMCAFWRFNSKDVRLSAAEWYMLLDELRQCGTRSISFSGGEPLLFDDLIPVLEKAYRLNFKLSITTNGTLVDNEYAHVLTKYFNNVRISLHSGIEKTHDHITQIDGSFLRTLDGIERLNSVRHKNKNEKKTKLTINVVINKLNYKTADTVIDVLKTTKVDEIQFSLITLNTNFTPVNIRYDVENFNKEITALGLTFEEFRHYMKYVIPKIRAKAKRENLHVKWLPNNLQEVEVSNNLCIGRSGIYKNINTYCFAPYLTLCITPFGRILPCDAALLQEHQYIMGDVKRNRLSEIWNNEQFKKFRAHCQPPSYSFCHACCHVELNKRLMKYRFLSYFIK